MTDEYTAILAGATAGIASINDTNMDSKNKARAAVRLADEVMNELDKPKFADRVRSGGNGERGL